MGVFCMKNKNKILNPMLSGPEKKPAFPSRLFFHLAL
jgi:hypothetical protein